MLTLDKIYSSERLIRGVARRTDLIKGRNIESNCELYLKTENLQVTGSFKIRGAYCKISQLSKEEKAKGVIACSAGNHAQGVALAASKENISSLVCVPEFAPISKIEATKKYGTEVLKVKGTFDDAYTEATKIQKESGRIFIHPFNDVDIIAGQGTIGLEILDQVDDIDAIVVPIGGGGLISGIAYTVKTINPRIKVYGVQAANVPSMYEQIKQEKPKKANYLSTIADGIAVKHPGDITLALCKKYLDDVVTVTEEEISTAILTLMEKQKLIVEGAGAASIAAILFNKLPTKNKKVVSIVSGGNIDVNILSRVINKGLIKTGRIAKFRLLLSDKLGQLKNITAIIANTDASIISMHHDRADKHLNISDCYVDLIIETKNFEHVKEIKDTLIKNGYDIVDD